MKYIAKYLPVEGKAEKGDVVLSVSGELYILTGAGGPLDSKWATSIIPKDPYRGGVILLTGFKKVKLFLTSTDIKAGDEFRFKDLALVSLGSGDMDDRYWIIAAHLGKKVAFDKAQCFKKIGEISSDAIWVTEGMELQKEDLIANGVGVNWNDSYGKWKFKVMCPTCKTFH